MRKLVIGLALLLITVAANGETTDDFTAKMQGALRKAKNKQEVESVLMYCRAQIRAMNFKQHDQAMVAGLKAMEKNDIEEANKQLKRAREIDELSDNLGAVACRKR
ncbi:hypothetical protein [Nitrobacter sp. JJSN]|uniref:hypothetical protein n=1 Tax=Nitrobacter sp. JJSN TaxID=3453033 RepID=UPI003F7633AA